MFEIFAIGLGNTERIRGFFLLHTYKVYKKKALELSKKINLTNIEKSLLNVYCIGKYKDTRMFKLPIQF